MSRSGPEIVPDVVTHICRGLRSLWLTEREDDGGVVGGLFERARALVDLTAFEAICEGGREEEVVDADAAVVLEGLAEVVPEGEVAGLSGMQERKASV